MQDSSLFQAGSPPSESVQYLNVCGLASGFFTNQGVKPKEYWMYFEAEQRRVVENPPSSRARGDTEQALRGRQMFPPYCNGKPGEKQYLGKPILLFAVCAAYSPASYCSCWKNLRICSMSRLTFSGLSSLTVRSLEGPFFRTGRPAP